MREPTRARAYSEIGERLVIAMSASAQPICPDVTARTEGAQALERSSATPRKPKATRRTPTTAASEITSPPWCRNATLSTRGAHDSASLHARTTPGDPARERLGGCRNGVRPFDPLDREARRALAP
jgi:hypothetical protein